MLEETRSGHGRFFEFSFKKSWIVGSEFVHEASNASEEIKVTEREKVEGLVALLMQAKPVTETIKMPQQLNLEGFGYWIKPPFDEAIVVHESGKILGPDNQVIKVLPEEAIGWLKIFLDGLLVIAEMSEEECYL